MNPKDISIHLFDASPLEQNHVIVLFFSSSLYYLSTHMLSHHSHLNYSLNWELDAPAWALWSMSVRNSAVIRLLTLPLPFRRPAVTNHTVCMSPKNDPSQCDSVSGCFGNKYTGNLTDDKKCVRFFFFFKAAKQLLWLQFVDSVLENGCGNVCFMAAH